LNLENSLHIDCVAAGQTGGQLFSKHWSTPLLIAGIGYCVFAMWNNQLDTLLFYPILVNALMLLIFGWSLFYPPV